MTRAIACIKHGSTAVEIEVNGYLMVAGTARRRRGKPGAAPCQFDLLLASLAACTALTLQAFAAARAWPLVSLDVYLALDYQAGGLTIERRLLMTGIDAGRQAVMLEQADLTPVTRLLAATVCISTVLV